MGFSRRKSPELTAQQQAEQARLAKEKEAQEFALKEQKRLREKNLVGFRSLISEEESGLDLRGKTKNMGKSIRG
tara:strand:- start:234 stop:455 length:222 start_codon:yes stop_codon:yes gene_type:complete